MASAKTFLIASCLLMPFAAIAMEGQNCGLPLQAPALTPENETVIARSQKEAGRLMQIKAKGTASREVFNKPDQVQLATSGVPATAQLLNPGETIFRHYSSKEGVLAIVEKFTIRAGNMNYVIRSSGYREDFTDLTGAFLTQPGSNAQDVGVITENSSYVDLKLYAGTGLIDLEPGIFLIPGARNYPQWLVESYEKFLSSGVLPKAAAEIRAVQDLAAQNGNHPLEIPVRVVGYSIR